MSLSKRFYRPDEVAELLALSRRTIYRMIRDSRLRACRWGQGPWRIPLEEVRRLLNEALMPAAGGENAR